MVLRRTLQPCHESLNSPFNSLPPLVRTSEPISRDWVEGPSPMHRQWWYIYYDRYTKPQHYGAIRSKDLKPGRTSPQSNSPGHRHGTILRIDPETANRLRAVRR